MNELLTYAVMLRFTHSSICTIHDNVDGHGEHAESGSKAFV